MLALELVALACGKHSDSADSAGGPRMLSRKLADAYSPLCCSWLRPYYGRYLAMSTGRRPRRPIRRFRPRLWYARGAVCGYHRWWRPT